MMRFLRKIFSEKGYTAIEAVAVVSVFAIIIGACIGLMETGYWMDRQAEDGYEAQNEGRRVLSEMVKLLRPSENINSNEVPLVHALNDGTLIDVRADTEKDSRPEIARFQLDREGERIVMYLDYPDEDNKYGYQLAGQTYLEYYGEGTSEDPTQENHYDEIQEIAYKIVNTPPGGDWEPQTPATDANEDYRLFTFYGDDFDDPLDTVSLPNWVNYIRGVKIYIWSDIQPAEIPSPFGIQSNVHLRNIQGE